MPIAWVESLSLVTMKSVPNALQLVRTDLDCCGIGLGCGSVCIPSLVRQRARDWLRGIWWGVILVCVQSEQGAGTRRLLRRSLSFTMFTIFLDGTLNNERHIKSEFPPLNLWYLTSAFPLPPEGSVGVSTILANGRC
jgi:hypothetical protein